MIKNRLRHALAAAFLLASGTGSLGFAAEVETELNDTVGSAQRLVIGPTGSVEVMGAVGVVTGDVQPDVDFYSFHGRAGDVVTIDLDGGMKPAGSSVRSLDSVLAIFAPDFTVLRQIDDVPASSVDTGSISRFDARLDEVQLPVTGVYTIGVASSGRLFVPGGTVTPFVARSTSNGSYQLIVSGVSPSVQLIGIDIKPRTRKIARINPQSRQAIRVALLSSPEFDPLKADRDSITFGPADGAGTGGRCRAVEKDRHYGHHKHGRDDDRDENDDGDDLVDFNGDRVADLLCRFEIRAAGFDEGDTEGMIRGTIGGMPFEGRGWLKVIPVKKHRHDD